MSLDTSTLGFKSKFCKHDFGYLGIFKAIKHIEKTEHPLEGS